MILIVLDSYKKKAALATLVMSSFVGSMALAEEGAASSPISASVGLGYGSKAQYFQQPSENYSLIATAGYTLDQVHTFGLKQSILYRRDFTDPRDGKAYREELTNSDLKLSYGYGKSLIEFPESLHLSLAPSAELVLGTSRESSANANRYGVASGELGLDWTPYEWLSLGTNVGADAYAYKETLSKYGEANERYSLSFGFSASLKNDRVTFAQAVGWAKTYLHEDWNDLYTFVSSSSLSFALPEDFTLAAGLLTTDDQLRYGRNRNFRMYDKDITRFTLTLTKKIL